MARASEANGVRNKIRHHGPLARIAWHGFAGLLLSAGEIELPVIYKDGPKRTRFGSFHLGQQKLYERALHLPALTARYGNRARFEADVEAVKLEIKIPMTAGDRISAKRGD